MIISRFRNFIFVRTRKVAGTSIEFALSRYCGDDDVVTPIRNDIERSDLGVWPRNFMRLPRLEDEYKAIIAARDPVRLLRAQYEMRSDMIFWDHVSARHIRDRVGDAFWNGAHKFSVIRHPYEFVVSPIYFDMSERGRLGAGGSYFRDVLPVIIRGLRNIDLISIDGRIAVDSVLRYESLTDELRNLSAVIGVDISNDLPSFKAGIRPAAATANAVLTPWFRELVRWRWRREFKTFGYSV
jgi:hypothetical protein